jgi:hypothetical protein
MKHGYASASINLKAVLELSKSQPLKDKVFDQVKLNALCWDSRKGDKDD